ncbi:MAG: ROK family protein [Sphaerochaeta sp.]
MYLKSQNRKLVFDLFREHKELSRAQIAKMTEMSFPTAMKVVDFLISKNVVTDLGEENTKNKGPGRRSRILQFNPEAFHAIGVEVEGSLVRIGRVNLQGEISLLQTVTIKSHENLGYFDEVLQIVSSLIESSEIPPLGVGIGFPANINPETNEIVSYNPLFITQPTALKTLIPLIEQLHIPFFIDNDVNLACAGENLVTNGTDEHSLVYLTLGTGFGSGIIADGRLWRGERFSAGEVGNLLTGPIDSKAHRFPGISSLEKQINIAAIKERFSVELEHCGPLDDALRSDIVDYLVPYLGTTIFNLLVILDIRHYVLSGIIPDRLGPLLFERLSAMLNTLPEELGHVEVHPPHGSYPVVSGAAAMVFDQVIFQEFSE